MIPAMDSAGVKNCKKKTKKNDFINVKEGLKMSRRGNIAKLEVLAEPIYNSMLVTRLVEGKDWLVKAVAAKKEPACYHRFPD